MMNCRIVMCDYSLDWAFRENYLEERPTGMMPAPHLSLEDAIAFFGTMGVDGVELFHHYWADMPASRVKSICSDAGLPIYGYIIFVDLLSETPEGRAVAVGQVRSLLDRAAELGAKLCMIVPAVLKDSISLEEQKNWLIAGLRECAEHAGRVGVQLACENLDYPPARPLLGTGRNCADTCAAVDHPGFRLIFDTSAPLFLDEDPVDALHAMRPYLVHVHLKNSRLLYQSEVARRYRDSISGRRFTGTVLDGGLVDIPKMLSELDSIGYTGAFQIEYQGEYDPRAALVCSLEFVRRQMER